MLGEQAFQLPTDASLLFPGSEKAAQVLDQIRRNALSNEVPNHGAQRAQLVFRVEAHAVVDQPEMVVCIEQEMPGLPVGVVDQQIEERHGTKPLLLRFLEREIVPLGIGVDIELKRAGAFWGILAEDGRGDQAPAEGLAQAKGRNLAMGKRAVREIPKRPFPARWLVDGLHRFIPQAHLSQEGVVRAPEDLPYEFKGTLRQGCQDRREMAGVERVRAGGQPIASRDLRTGGQP